MKKVININFQGRVVPIEETAFELLKQYIESLRRYFANEEGRDEIINDIESRIAELFSERLKKGAVCITDDDVNAIIASMGRPEDFDADDNATTADKSTTGNTYQDQQSGQQQKTASSFQASGRGRLYRNADDKLIAGVASGIANYLGIDPIVMRIVFFLLAAPLFWVYILLWVIIPSQSIQSNITKRLYRSADDKIISGVSGGLAAYFNIAPWIPRLIFALPLIVGLISGPLDWWWDNWDWNFWWGPKIITSSISSSLFVTYIILWIAVPVAVTSAEKLEMRGEKVDLNSIRDTVKEDLEGFKGRAEKWGKEVKQSAMEWGEKAKEFGQTAGSRAKTFSSEAAPIARHAGSGIGHAIGVLFKVFFMFIAGIIVLSLFGVLAGILFGGFTVIPAKEFLLDGVWQNAFAWGALLLFLGIPIIALLTWIVRRIMGVRTRNHYLGYIFSTLWFIGLVCVILLLTNFSREFMAESQGLDESINITQPATGKFYIDVQGSHTRHYYNRWYGTRRNEWPFYVVNQDTVMLNTVRINIAKSKDNDFHVYRVRFSSGRTPEKASRLAQNISFEIRQQDSTLILPQSFGISRTDKFRNQQVLVVIEVPVGKRIELSKNVDRYDWFNIDFGSGVHYTDDWDRTYHWSAGQEYVMTDDQGLLRTDVFEHKKGKTRLKAEYNGGREEDLEETLKRTRKEREEELKNTQDSIKKYRYHSSPKETVDTTAAIKKTAAIGRPVKATLAADTRTCIAAEFSGPLAALTRLL